MQLVALSELRRELPYRGRETYLKSYLDKLLDFHKKDILVWYLRIPFKYGRKHVLIFPNEGIIECQEAKNTREFLDKYTARISFYPCFNPEKCYLLKTLEFYCE